MANYWVVLLLCLGVTLLAVKSGWKSDNIGEVTGAEAEQFPQDQLSKDDEILDSALLPDRLLADDLDTSVSDPNASSFFPNATHNSSSTEYYNGSNLEFQETPASSFAPTEYPYSFEGMQGALVTSDCLFNNDYAYAIDISWSCGNERFNNPLRLHTFKRHSRSHRMVFQDQLITFRDNQLWYDAYNIPRCIRVDEEELRLSSTATECTQFDLLSSTDESFRIRETNTERCMGLGSDNTCNSDRSTGGEECGGVDHRYLPLEMGTCDRALIFRFETEAQDCANNENERPRNSCFGGSLERSIGNVEFP